MKTRQQKHTQSILKVQQPYIPPQVKTIYILTLLQAKRKGRWLINNIV